MSPKKALCASLLCVVSLGCVAGEEPANYESAKRSAGELSLPSVEKINRGFPEAMRGSQGVMEAASAVDRDEVAEFFILKGEKLREAMERWTRTAGYELVWQPKPEDGDVRFAANMNFRSTFAGATEEFFRIVREQTKFDAQLHSNGVLRVFVATAKR